MIGKALDFFFGFVLGGAAAGCLVGTLAGVLGSVVGAPFGDSGPLSAIFALAAFVPASIIGGLWFWEDLREW